MLSFLNRINELVVKIGTALQSPFLLIIRLYWGWQFFNQGKNKFADIDTYVERFTGWGIPMPKLNVYMAATTECVGGLLLVIGLLSRFASIPLIFTMVVAYLTADLATVKGIFDNPDAFVSAAEFQFMLTAIIILIFGPGAFSADRWILKRA